jgi:hypothetical protein
MDGNSLAGEVQNLSKEEITGAFFMYNTKNSVRIGNLPAGSTRSFSLKLNDSSMVPFTEVHLRNLLNLYNLSYSNPHFLFGEIRSKGQFLINGKSQETDCLKYVAVFVQIANGEPGTEWSTEKGMRKIWSQTPS